MKTILVLASLFLLSFSVASASLLDCSVSGVLTSGPDEGLLSSSSTITCGNLTFSGFSVVGTTGGAPGTVFLEFNPSSMSFDATYDSVTGVASLTFNPSLVANQDEELEFVVTGGLTNIGGSVGGVGASVTETACSSPFSGITCTGNILAELALASGQSGNCVSTSSYTCPFNTTSPVYIFKDIQTHGTSSGLSEFTETFVPGTTPTVPEPVSMILLGSGLLGLGLLRRRSRKD